MIVRIFAAMCHRVPHAYRTWGTRPRRARLSGLILVALALPLGVSCGVRVSTRSVDLSPPYDVRKYDTLRVGGLERTYMVFVPSCYEEGVPIPLVMNFHGGGGTGEAAEIGSGGMNVKAEAECFIAVYPNGVSIIGEPGRRQHWNAGPRAEPRNQGVDDVGFVAAMLDTLEQQYSIDETRVYATGISNGAMMCHRLACDLSDRIAAIAAVGAGMLAHECVLSREVSVMQFHGTADPGWPYLGGAACYTRDVFQPITETMERWRAFDGCAETMRTTFENGDVLCESYDGCAGDAEVTLCTIQDGGHTWPGGTVFPSEELLKFDRECALGTGMGVGAVTQDISALDAMWQFFEGHRIAP